MSVSSVNENEKGSTKNRQAQARKDLLTGRRLLTRNDTMERTGCDPLVPEASADGTIVKVLDGHSYALNPSRLDKPPRSNAVVQTAKLATLVLSPVIAVSAALLTIPMLIQPIRNYVLSWFLPCVCSALGKKFSKERTILLANVRGKVLDVGCGGGAYLRYALAAREIVALEPVVELHVLIRQQAKKWLNTDNGNNISIFRQDLESYLQEFPEEAGTFDWVILGNVLCEVGSVRGTLASVDRALTANGMVYFSEHVGCQCASWRRLLQNMLNPWWCVISGGCNINRDSLQCIQSMSNWKVIAWTYTNVKVGMGPFVLGLAQKQG